MAENIGQFRKGTQRTKQAARKSGLISTKSQKPPTHVHLPSSEFEETDLA